MTVSQPEPSEIATVQTPAQSCATVPVPCPTGGAGVQVKVSGPPPPVAFRSIEASQAPEQTTGFTTGATSIAAGAPMVTWAVVSHPLLSVITTV